jgi:hypothetical protein
MLALRGLRDVVATSQGFLSWDLPIILRNLPEYHIVGLRAEHWALQKGDGAQA